MIADVPVASGIEAPIKAPPNAVEIGLACY